MRDPAQGLRVESGARRTDSEGKTTASNIRRPWSQHDVAPTIAPSTTIANRNSGWFWHRHAVLPVRTVARCRSRGRPVRIRTSPWRRRACRADVRPAVLAVPDSPEVQREQGCVTRTDTAAALEPLAVRPDMLLLAIQPREVVVGGASLAERDDVLGVRAIPHPLRAAVLAEKRAPLLPANRSCDRFGNSGSVRPRGALPVWQAVSGAAKGGSDGGRGIRVRSCASSPYRVRASVLGAPRLRERGWA